MNTNLHEIFSQIHQTKQILHTLHQTKIEWLHPPKRLLIVKKLHDAELDKMTCLLIEWLSKKDYEIYLEYHVFHGKFLDTQSDSIQVDTTLSKLTNQLRSRLFSLSMQTSSAELVELNIDLIVSLGGDGTVLHVASLFQQEMPPVMAFHLGSLGFLTVFNMLEFRASIDALVSTSFRLTLRMRLSCTLRSFDAQVTRSEHEILNEVVIDRGPSPYMVLLDVLIDGKLVTTVQADGLIIATPTGSTAYSLSAGGSISHPDIPCILMTPICAHTLAFRPILLPCTSEIQIRVPQDSRSPGAWVSFDGRARTEICRGETIHIKGSSWPVPTVCQSDATSDWFQRLSSCLHWNQRERQKLLFLPEYSSGP